MSATAPSAPASRPRRRWLRWLLLGLALVLLLPLAALGIFLATFDAEAWKPRLVAAVEGATGRRLELGGIGVKFSLVPTLTLDQVALANMPGGSRPQMLTVRQAEVELALLPLLSRRVELRRLVLVAPDILLETDAQGRGNWAFSPPAAARPAPSSPTAGPVPAGPGEAPQRPSIVVGRVEVTEGQLTWRNGATGQSRRLGIPQLQARAENGTGPLRLEGALALDGRPFTLAGEFGPLDRLLDPAATAPWPAKLALEAEGARLALDGSIARPREGKGWGFAVQARVPDLARLAGFVPDLPLPPLRDLDLALRAAEGTTALPDVSELRLSLGESDLNALWPGLRLASLNASLPRADQPLALRAQASARGVPLVLEGSLGAPALLLNRGQGAAPWPLDLTLQAANASARLQGQVANPAEMLGVDLALALRAPDLSGLAPLLGNAALPPLRDLALETRIAERGGAFFAGGAFLRGLRLTSSAGDLAGDLTLVIGERAGVVGALTSQRLDLAALRPPAAPAATPAETPATPPPAPARDGRLIPDLPLPLEALRLTDSDLRWQVAELVTPGLPLREVTLHAVLQGGKARLDPLSATLPGGRLTLRAAADVTTDPPAVQVAAETAGLDLGPLLAALQAPQRIGGRLDLSLDLRGRGRDLRAVAASAHGPAQLRVANLQLPPGLLPRQVGGFPLPVDSFAISTAQLALQAEAGLGRVRELAVETSFGRITGEGVISLRDESLALRLNTDLRVPVPSLPQGLRIRAPVPVTGTLAAPRLDWQGVEGAAAGAVAGELLNRALPNDRVPAPAQELLRQLPGLFGRGR